MTRYVSVDIGHDCIKVFANGEITLQYKCHWNIWLYKDIGMQGMVYTDPESKYMKTIVSWLDRKRRLQLDAWGRYDSKVRGFPDHVHSLFFKPCFCLPVVPPTGVYICPDVTPYPSLVLAYTDFSQEVEDVILPLTKYIDDMCPTSKDNYPPNWPTERQITRLVNQIYMANCTQDEFASLFKDMSFEELDECAKSFSFERCMQRQVLNKKLEEHSNVGEITKDFVRGTNNRPDLGKYKYSLEQGV